MSGCSSLGGVCSLDDSVVTLLAFPYLRVGELLDCGVYGVSWLQSLRSRLPFVVRPPFHVSVCPSPALGLGWFGHRSVTPPAAPGFWALLVSRLRRSDALASGRTLSLFSRQGFLPWAFVRTWVGRLRSSLGSYLLLEVLSFPCPGFRWAVPAVWLSRRLVFSWNLSLGSSLSLPVFADDLGWLGLILGYPPSVAWLWRLLPWFFVRYLLACPRGAAVPLDSVDLWCSCSSR